jgi:nucleotide-binding universal stress UspA family protein
MYRHWGELNNKEQYVMSGNIVVAVDGSPGSERALQTAINLAKATGAALTLVHIIEWSPFSFHTPDELAERHKRREEELGRAKEAILGSAETKAKDAGLTCEAIVRHGHPAETVVEIAEGCGASQIFIGRKGQSKMGSLLFGSVAGSLVQISPVPVTVVP